MPIRKKRDAASHEVDPLIPIMNLVCMLIPLLIFGVVFVRYNVIDVEAPRGDITSEPRSREALNLTVMITDRGFHFRVNPIHRMPWMVGARGTADTGPDIPKRDDRYDFKALEERLREIKTAHRQENGIILGAEDDIDYDVLIKTMDFSRGAKGDLFPNVTLTRGVS